VLAAGGDIDGAYIKDATIETASIGSAQVESLQIRNNAVTVPAGARKASGEVQQILDGGPSGWETLWGSAVLIDTGRNADEQPKAFNVTAHAAVQESGRGWTYFAARIRVLWGNGAIVLGYTTGYCNQGSPAGIAVTGHAPMPPDWNWTQDCRAIIEMTNNTQSLRVVDWSIQATAAKR
jgi:hypothetical protein